MGKRSTARRIAMQALYQVDYGVSNIEEAIFSIFEEEKIVSEISETHQFAYKLALGTFNNIKNIDKLIQKYAKSWKLDRIGGVDRNILRLAFFELENNETPPQVIINEALELAKRFSSAEASKFINGILGAYMRESGKK